MEGQGVSTGSAPDSSPSCTLTRRRFLQAAGGVAAIAVVGGGVHMFAGSDGAASHQGAAVTPSVEYSTEELVALRHQRHRNQALGGYVDSSDPFHRCECGCTSGLFAHHFDSGRQAWL
jgi:hypothetical protein